MWPTLIGQVSGVAMNLHGLNELGCTYYGREDLTMRKMSKISPKFPRWGDSKAPHWLWLGWKVEGAN